jgi:hypothetical protein
VPPVDAGRRLGRASIPPLALQLMHLQQCGSWSIDLFLLRAKSNDNDVRERVYLSYRKDSNRKTECDQNHHGHDPGDSQILEHTLRRRGLEPFLILSSICPAPLLPSPL